jgi:crotonobetainyl-CoA:carnitine CoA-transferase CaiB-like acyl-CoA transferase
VNRGKLGITLNLKAPAGRALLERLLVKTDIVIHSFLPESAARLGLSFSDVKVVNPEIIYCSINGYGPQGELHNKAGYDLMMQAYSGIMSTTGYPDGPPVRAGVSFIDMTTGIVAYGGVMTALVKRLQGGGGSKVTASLLETAISLLGYHAVTWLQAGQLPTKEGSGVFHLVPYQAFQCQDGYLLVGATNDLAWQRFCVALGHADLAMDARFKTNDKRLAHRSVLVGVIEGILATAPVASWLVRFDVQGVAAAPINTLDQVLVDPQVLANHMVTAVVNADGQSLPVLGVPFKLSGDHSVANNSAPQLGADTDAVLRDELQISANEIEVLRAQGVI